MGKGATHGLNQRLPEPSPYLCISFQNSLLLGACPKFCKINIQLSTFPSIHSHPSIHLPIHLFNYPFIHPSTHLLAFHHPLLTTHS